MDSDDAKRRAYQARAELSETAGAFEEMRAEILNGLALVETPDEAYRLAMRAQVLGGLEARLMATAANADLLKNDELLNK